MKMKLNQHENETEEYLSLNYELSSLYKPTSLKNCSRKEFIPCMQCFLLQKKLSASLQGRPNIRREYKTSGKLCGFDFATFRLWKGKVTVKTFLKFFFAWTFIFSPAINLVFKTVFSNYTLFGTILLVEACHPGRNNNGGTRPRAPIALHPFQVGEYVPKVSEQTIGASGPAEGPIFRDSKRYKQNLERNFNSDIIFENEEGTNEDRIMTRVSINA